MNDSTRKYLAQMGRRGGQKSRRTLDPKTARTMVLLREARRAYRHFHTSCFWCFGPQYRPSEKDIPWIMERLRSFGGQDGWTVSARLEKQQRIQSELSHASH